MAFDPKKFGFAPEPVRPAAEPDRRLYARFRNYLSLLRMIGLVAFAALFLIFVEPIVEWWIHLKAHRRAR